MTYREAGNFAPVLVAVLVCCGLTRARAADGPVAVSPGDASELVLVEGRCPTFSWGAVPKASGYELVVFRVSEGGEESEPTLRETLAGAATSWTPSLERCLERGGEYGWTVRAVGETAESAWSPPRFFRVASGPTVAEFKEALRVVRSYVGTGGKARPEAEDNEVANSPPSAGPPTEPTDVTLLVPPAATRLRVDGNVDAVSFTGDGANLTGLVSEAGVLVELCNHHVRRYLDQGDGTVLDCHTGLIWLKNANCFGIRTWAQAQSDAAGLASGSCGLTDGSSPGTWRQPTISEFCSAGAIEQVCPPANAWDSLIDSSVSGAPKVVNAIGIAQWSEGDPFLDVRHDCIWSATDYTDSSSAWWAYLYFGRVEFGLKTGYCFVWPVRGGP